ncbi:hypothetical protein MCUN1_003924 [Malassezia cuniculi]|uniref:Anaphase-promoting complex subunit 4 n=1 Tax=Malassezia cuniculi TaxID=948313 RepID=A0AAF0J7V3_9BASI|nr:hypothetical protein MCUN1_003924 [Malassezia cuniculi]
MERARVRLPRESRLVATAPNPCMDLVALLCRDNAPARTGPPGLTPAQLAMRQRMLAIQARRMGNAHAAASPSGIERGPALKLALWRTGSSDAALWEVPIIPPQFDSDAPQRAGTKEAVAVTSLVWSPDGERLAVTLDAVRSEKEKTHAATLLIFSIYDGAVLHTRQINASLDPCTALWLPYHHDHVPSQALDMLKALAPLAVVGDVAPAETRPGARPLAPAAERPSAHIPKGKGALSHVPTLPMDPASLGWVRRTALATSRAFPQAKSLLLVADADGRIHILLDGTIGLGSTSAAGSLVGGDACRVCLVGRAITALELPLESNAIITLAQLSTALHAHLAYASDAAFGARAAWLGIARPKAAEWRQHIHSVSKRHASDVRAELMMILMTGCTAPASEQLLLHNMTEGITLSMERDARHGLKTIRRLAGTGLLPACERILILLQELRGCALWAERFPGLEPYLDSICSIERAVQTCIAVAFALVEHAEMELLALDEFFKWWRMEQDRQEKIKLGDDAPRTVPCHDTLTVLEFLQRGFISPQLDALLGRPDPPPKRPADESDDSDNDEPDESVWEIHYQDSTEEQEISAVDAAEESLAWLSSKKHGAQPTPEQVLGVYSQKALFVPSSSDYIGEEMLPGDKSTILQRLERVARSLAAVLEPAFEHAIVGAAASTVTTDLLDTRSSDCAMRSAPAGFEPAVESLVVRRGPPESRTAALFVGDSSILFVRTPLNAEPVGARIEFAEHVVDAAFYGTDELVILARSSSSSSNSSSAAPASVSASGTNDTLRGISLTPLVFEPLASSMRTQTCTPTFEVPVSQYASDSDDAFLPSALAVHSGRQVTLLGGRGQTLAFIATL